MNYRQNYEELLQTQCDAYQQMIQIITQISECDDCLLSSSIQDTPDVNKVHEITYKKESLIQKLDTLSIHTEQSKGRIADILYLYKDFQIHPLYLRMTKLQEIVRTELQQVIDKEDNNNPSITNKLTQYKEKLETDIKIREIPMEKRKIFFIYPDK